MRRTVTPPNVLREAWRFTRDVMIAAILIMTTLLAACGLHDLAGLIRG
jgi:hypothetical protein